MQDIQSAPVIETETPQAGAAGYEQLFADIGMAVGVTETPANVPEQALPEPGPQIQQPEAGKSDVSDEMFANLLADIGNFAEAAEEPAAIVAEITPQATPQSMPDLGKISEPAAAGTGDSAAVLQPVVKTIAKPADAASRRRRKAAGLR